MTVLKLKEPTFRIDQQLGNAIRNMQIKVEESSIHKYWLIRKVKSYYKTDVREQAEKADKRRKQSFC